MTAALEVGKGRGIAWEGDGQGETTESKAMRQRWGTGWTGSEQRQPAETWEGAASQGAMGVPATTAATITGSNLWEPLWRTWTRQGAVTSPWWKGHSGRDQQIGGGKFGSREAEKGLLQEVGGTVMTTAGAVEPW